MYAKEENGKYAFFPSDSGKIETMTDPPVCTAHCGINNYKRKLGAGSRCPLHLCVQWPSISSVENLCWFLPLKSFDIPVISW